MKYKLVLTLTGVLLVTIIISILLIIPSSRPYSIWNTSGNGYSKLIYRYGFKPLHEIIPNIIRQANSTIIIYPVFRQIEDFNRTVEFVDKGGTLILIDEKGYSNELLYLYFHLPIIIDNHTVYDEIYCYKGKRENPLIYKYDSKNVELIGWTPAAIKLLDTTNVSIIEEYTTSKFSYIDKDNNKYYTPGDEFNIHIIILSIKYGYGRLIIISDYDIISNSYIELGDNNLFLIRYLENKTIRYILVSSMPYTVIDSIREITLYMNSNTIDTKSIISFILITLLIIMAYIGEKRGA